jgi:hypothetical protein
MQVCPFLEWDWVGLVLELLTSGLLWSDGVLLGRLQCACALFLSMSIFRRVDSLVKIGAKITVKKSTKPRISCGKIIHSID